MACQLTRRGFLARMGGLALATAGGGSLARASGVSRPNIVVILADDLGYGDVGCYGCTDIRTPNIDSIAADGVRFTNFYANAPECTPTRTALLTGRYQHRVGGLECALGVGNVGRYDDAIRLRKTHDMGLPSSEKTISRILKGIGYSTAVCGKWHLGYEPKFFPDRHGFDHWFGPVGGATDYFHHIEYTGENALYLDGEPTEREGYMTDLITDEAVNYVKSDRNVPFFLYVAYTAPHTPYQGPDDYDDEPVAEADYNKGTRQTYVEMVERMDRGVGRILDAIRQIKAERQTLVIFMSDNGANRTGDNGPFFGYKGNLFEGGIRVPCVAKWPGYLRPSVKSDQPCMTLDFTRSIARAAVARPSEYYNFDGIDILDKAALQRPVSIRAMFWRARRGTNTRKAVRFGDLKYIHLNDGDKTSEYLFDLKADPAEKNNLLGSRTYDLRQLRKLLADWEQQVRHSR